jgi:3-phenylpropionate/cinnamic acid dioxygenase small subunit
MGAGTWESYHAITTLMFRYAECIDAADFDGLGELFASAAITNEGYPGAIAGRKAVAKLYRSTNRVHNDGTLRTRHLTTNVIVDIDEDADTATARSAFVVFQATPELPLQPIVTGRYHDRFARVEGQWSFAARHILLEQRGDVRHHLHPNLIAQLHDPTVE